MKAGVIIFPGSNCDRDTYWVLSKVLGAETRYLWHDDTQIDDLDLVVLPGGFSYGDYLRTGAFARKREHERYESAYNISDRENTRDNGHELAFPSNAS